MNRSACPPYRPRHQPVLKLLLGGPATDQELSFLLSLTASNANRRRRELVRMGLVEFADMTRPTVRGYPAAVWRITAAGRAQLVRKGGVG